MTKFDERDETSKKAKQEYLEREGISAFHVDCFLAVAEAHKCVILTRTPGIACLTLLAEGYDAKGFHVKGKSCDWGPMAGLICAHPLFNKSGVGGAGFNVEAHAHSLDDDFEAIQNANRAPQNRQKAVSSLVHAEITDERFKWLVGKKFIEDKADPKDGNIRVGECTTPVRVKWLLKRDKEGGRWKIYYDPTGLPAFEAKPDKLKILNEAIDKKSTEIGNIGAYRPVLAMTNPFLPYTGDEAYKNALTGDFDLFAVWPHGSKPAKELAEFDVRVAGMHQGITPDQIKAAEKSSLVGSIAGNISEGVFLVAQALNAKTQSRAAEAKINRVFHSDEGGRPDMDAIDAAAAFHPSKEVHGFGKNAPDFGEFALRCANEGYVVYLNTGWAAKLKELMGPKYAELEKKIRWQKGVVAAK